MNIDYEHLLSKNAYFFYLFTKLSTIIISSHNEKSEKILKNKIGKKLEINITKSTTKIKVNTGILNKISI